MKLREILLSRSVRLLRISGPEGRNLYGLKLVRALEDKYGFVESPRSAEAFDLTKGVLFLHGIFEDMFLIDKLQIFNNGIAAEGKFDTAVCDRFLDDVISTIAGNAGAEVNQPDGLPSFYMSNLEVNPDLDRSPMIERMNQFGRALTGVLRSYGQQHEHDMSFYGLQMRMGRGAPTPMFILEQSENRDAPSGTFFSNAPLKTSDHLRMLNELEKMLAT